MLRIIAPAMLLLATIQAHAQSPVERGKYLVDTVMTCHNCHTPRGPGGAFMMDKALSGGMRFNEPPFDVTASNLTPDRNTGLGSWSEADMKKFLVTGERPNGVTVAAIMPTSFYKVLTARDLDGIVKYLRSLPPVANEVPAPIYKINVPHPVVPGAQTQMTEADLTDKVKRGFYLVTIGHCMECHTPMGPRGRDFDNTGKGGFEFKGPWGVSVSRNITSHREKGLGAWTDAEIKRAITEGVSRDETKLKPPMGFDFYRNISNADMRALIAYFRSLRPLPLGGG